MAKSSVWRSSRRILALYRFERAGCLWSVNFIHHSRAAGIVRGVSIALLMAFLAGTVIGAEPGSQRKLDPRLS